MRYDPVKNDIINIIKNNKNFDKNKNIQKINLNDYLYSNLNVKQNNISTIDKTNTNFFSENYLNKLNNIFTNKKQQTRTIIEESEYLQDLPKSFIYEGFTYNLIEGLNIFVNQFGHKLSPFQALAFIKMPALGEHQDINDIDGGNKTKIFPPETPSNLSATMTLSGVTLGWTDNSFNEESMDIYFRRELI